MLLNKKSEIFVIYIIALKPLLIGIIIYSLQKTQIAILKQNKAIIKISTNYFDF